MNIANHQTHKGIHIPTEVEWLESTGTQFITLDVGRYFGCDVFVDLFNSGNKANGHSIGRKTGDSRSDGLKYMSYQDRGVTISVSNGGSVHTQLTTKTMHHIVVMKTAVDVDGYQFSLESKWGDYSTSIGTTIALFGCYHAKNLQVEPVSCKFGRVKLFDGNGNMTYDLVPSKSQGVGCMYDTISQHLFFNQGSGEFITGPEVHKD